MYQIDDHREVVRQIQRMLRSIQIHDEETATVPVDGVFDTETTKAVRAFQERNDLPVTGEVDRGTFGKLAEKSRKADFSRSEPLPVHFCTNGRTASVGEKGDFVMILQILLNALTVGYDDYRPFEVNGSYDEKMAQSVRRFQMRNGLPATGDVDKHTWNALVTNYDKHRRCST